MLKCWDVGVLGVRMLDIRMPDVRMLKEGDRARS